MMGWIEWMADQHIKAMVFALAASVLIPFPLIAAQRPGRGIKPWWTTSRFLAWTGLIGAVFAVATGQFMAKSLGLLEGGWIIRDEWSDLRVHQYLGGTAILLGWFCIRAVHARRKEHEGLGAYALIVGLLWALVAVGAGHYGIKMAKARKLEMAARQMQLEPDIVTDQTSGSRRIMKMLDYASLTPIHHEPVRSAPHKNRWIRVWVTPGAVEAYNKGERLPEGATVVMNSVEDRWGRPGYDIGPLYFMEALPDGKTRLGLYWSNVPESKRGEVGGFKSVNWLEPNANLTACRECHAEGLAAHNTRVRRAVQAPRRPSPEAESSGGGQ